MMVRWGLHTTWVLTLLVALTSCGDRRADKAYLRDDYVKAARELEGLANLGEPRAQYNLAVLYDKGLGVPQNDAEALRWYMRAAEHGEARAQFNLGLMYMNGQGIEPNLIEAYYWVSLSTAQGNANGPSALDYLADKMTHEQINIAQKLVREKLTERLRPFAQ